MLPSVSRVKRPSVPATDDRNLDFFRSPTGTFGRRLRNPIISYLFSACYGELTPHLDACRFEGESRQD